MRNCKFETTIHSVIANIAKVNYRGQKITFFRHPRDPQSPLFSDILLHFLNIILVIQTPNKFVLPSQSNFRFRLRLYIHCCKACTMYNFHDSTDIFVNPLFLPFWTQNAPWISSKNRYLDVKSWVWPDMFLPTGQIVLFWWAPRCGLAKNCSKTPKLPLK